MTAPVRHARNRCTQPTPRSPNGAVPPPPVASYRYSPVVPPESPILSAATA
jgi:hypothetical protein